MKTHHATMRLKGDVSLHQDRLIAYSLGESRKPNPSARCQEKDKTPRDALLELAQQSLDVCEEELQGQGNT